MKKTFLCVMLLVIVTSTSVYAVEFTAGLSVQFFGMNNFRGEDAKGMIDDIEGLGYENIFNYAPVAIQADAMLELSPYFAIETGVGFRMFYMFYEGRIQLSDISPSLSGHMTFSEMAILRFEVVIPIMFRVQHEFEKVVVYGATGVKLGIPIVNDYIMVDLFGIEESLAESKFSMDVAFAVGFEVKISSDTFADRYIGLRVGYDLNVIRPTDPSLMGIGDDTYHDSFGVTLTTRYTFNMN